MKVKETKLFSRLFLKIRPKLCAEVHVLFLVMQPNFRPRQLRAFKLFHLFAGGHKEMSSILADQQRPRI